MTSAAVMNDAFRVNNNNNINKIYGIVNIIGMEKKFPPELNLPLFPQHVGVAPGGYEQNATIHLTLDWQNAAKQIQQNN